MIELPPNMNPTYEIRMEGTTASGFDTTTMRLLHPSTGQVFVVQSSPMMDDPSHVELHRANALWNAAMKLPVDDDADDAVARQLEEYYSKTQGELL